MTQAADALVAGDPEVAELIAREGQRQQDNLELIASENVASLAVMQATGSLLTNKYAEGAIGRRYYGGCQVVDEIEALAARRACHLFGAEYANLQPHSGTGANLAVYAAVLAPGDTILAMDLAAGGHLSHAAPMNLSGRVYRGVFYGVGADDERLDYDEIARLARQHRPKLIVCGASAYARTIDFARFGAIAAEVDAYLLADIAHIAGLVAAGEHPSPVPHASFVTTTTHKTLRGPRGGLILARRAHARALDQAMCPRTQGGPLMHVVAAKAVALAEAMGPGFGAYQRRVRTNAQALAAALAAGGMRPVSGGTDNHLVLIDLRPLGVTGRDAEIALDAAGITVNKNGIPFDERGPRVTSGIRLGTPTVTTRGMGPPEMATIAALVGAALAARQDASALARLAADTRGLTERFPLFVPRAG